MVYGVYITLVTLLLISMTSYIQHTTKDHLEKGANYTNPEDAVVVAWRGGGRWLTYIWSVDQWMVENSTVTFTPGTGNQGGEGTDHGTIRLTY